jgi:transposase-like protein
MHAPPFCPNSRCRYHGLEAPRPARWYQRAGFYRTAAFGQVQRYRCRACRRHFSDQTFALDYFVKRPLPYPTIFQRVTGTSGLRTIARALQVSHHAVVNRIGRLARQALAIQSQLCRQLVLGEDLSADGFESFVSSHYEPDNIHLLVGARSQFLYSFDYAHLRRKGRMSAAQKRRRQQRESRYVRAHVSVRQSFTRLLESAASLIETAPPGRYLLSTDEKLEYVQALAAQPHCRQLMAAGKLVHRRICSRRPRTLTNPLFPVNYLDRQLRKDCAQHVRETVQFARSVNNGLERLAVYQLYHNYYKPYRIDVPGLKEKLHGQVAGIDRRRIEQAKEGLWSRRRFLSHHSLSWSQALVWLRMVGNVDRPSGGYWPAYVWM